MGANGKTEGEGNRRNVKQWLCSKSRLMLANEYGVGSDVLVCRNEVSIYKTICIDGDTAEPWRFNRVPRSEFAPYLRLELTSGEVVYASPDSYVVIRDWVSFDPN